MNDDQKTAQDITRRVMDIVTRPDPRGAFMLAAALPAGAATFPDAAMLLNTPGLTAEQRHMMADPLPGVLAGDLAPVTARLGALGYSFPRWRFSAQGVNGPSLLEQSGLKRLIRPTDRFDSAAPPTPQNDRFGTGFVRHDGALTFELRRAYILCADRTPGAEAAVLIRNNSWFFGRDRLPAPVYVSWRALSPATLEKIDTASLAPGRAWHAWPGALTDAEGPSADEKIYRMQGLLRLLDMQLDWLDDWLRAPAGLTALAGLIENSCARQAAQGKDAPPFYLAAVPAYEAPWNPRAALAATYAVAAALRAPEPEKSAELNTLFKRLVHWRCELLSGPHGDFPVAPAP